MNTIKQKNLLIFIICLILQTLIFIGCGSLKATKDFNKKDVTSVQAQIKSNMSVQDPQMQPNEVNNTIVPKIKENNKTPSKNSNLINQEPFIIEIDWQALMSMYNPPSIDGLLQAINKSTISSEGDITITSEIKQEFNKMGNDYLFHFMPKVAWYDFQPIAYESTGEALSYILLTCMNGSGTHSKKISKYEAEARLRKIFASPDDNYPQLIHKEYRKCVEFDGESYSPWPEGYNNNTKVYDIINLKVRHDGDYFYYIASANEYQFDLTNAFEPLENDKFLDEQAQALGLDKNAALSSLLENGTISSAPSYRAYTIEFRIKNDNPIPMIISFDKQM